MYNHLKSSTIIPSFPVKQRLHRKVQTKRTMASRSHARSISLPSRSHPNTVRIEEELSKLKSWEASATSTSSGSICNGLSGLEDLYRSMDELLKMASTVEVLSKHEKCLEELLDGSVKLLDIGGTSRDVIFRLKEQVGALHSALRRRKGDSGIESSIAEYACFRRKMKKDAKKLIASLKQMENKIWAIPFSDQDHYLSAIIRNLREVNVMTSAVFQSLLFFLSTPVQKAKQSKWSLVSKLIHKGAMACEEKQQNSNELEIVDAALAEGSDSGKMQIAQKRMEALGLSIEEIEKCLECVFRHLIKTRASLLNIFS